MSHGPLHDQPGLMADGHMVTISVMDVVLTGFHKEDLSVSTFYSISQGKSTIMLHIMLVWILLRQQDNLLLH